MPRASRVLTAAAGVAVAALAATTGTPAQIIPTVDVAATTPAPTWTRQDPIDGPEASVKIWLTARTWWDEGADDLSHPVVHDRAGGVGTFEDPVSVSVGSMVIVDAWGQPQEWLDLEPGTVIWLPSLDRYGIVEDTCTPGASRPQVLPCRSGMPEAAADAGAVLWIQVWVGGGMTGTGDEARVAQCAAEVDAVTEMVLNPEPDEDVVAGPVFDADGCHA